MAMRDHLPAGLKGMLVASFFAAYMSTIATQLNWGTSYVINDFYKRFLKPNAGERDLVLTSRITTLLVMVLSLGVTLVLDTISGAWAFIIEAGAGLGLVLILRWFWWRISAWSEIAAMVAPLVTYGCLRLFTSIAFPDTLFVIVGVTTAAWLLVTLLTRPVDEATLHAFYRRVHPGGPGWAPIARALPEVRPDAGMARLLGNWLAGVVLVYSALFAVGKLLLGDYRLAAVFLSTGALAVGVIYRNLARGTGADSGAAVGAGEPGGSSRLAG